MDAKQALKIMKISPAIMGGDSIISSDIRNEVVKALEKQIPQKPIEHIDVNPIQDENWAYVDAEDHILHLPEMRRVCWNGRRNNI